MNKISFRWLSVIVMVAIMAGSIVPPAFSETATPAAKPASQTQAPATAQPADKQTPAAPATPVLNPLQTPSKPFQPAFTYRSAVLNQLGRGFSNMLYAAFEVPYRLKNEIQDVEPFRGVVPGTIKGISWCVARLAIGAFEILSFYAPRQKPYIEDFNTDWLYA